jgi:MoxR-like ATPase
MEKITKTTRTRATKDVMKVEKPLVIKNGSVVLNDYFMVDIGVYKIMERNIKKATNTLLLGPTGVGKTEMVKNIADRMDLPLTIFDMGTMTDPIMSLVGTHVIKVKDGATSSEFAKSRFSDVIQQPGVVLLDELSRASAAANNLLFPCLDFRRELSMEYCFEDCTPIKVHPDCVFIATANLGSQYTGTHKLDRALIDRFMMIEIDPLKEANIKQILKVHVPAMKDSDIETIVTCYTKINASHDSYTISFNLSIRHLKIVCELVRDGFTIYDSFFTICKGIGGKDGLKALAEILNNTKMK